MSSTARTSPHWHLMSSISFRPDASASPRSVETVPFQDLGSTLSMSLTYPSLPLPKGQVMRLVVAGRRLMSEDDAQLGPISDEARDEVRQQWPD